MDAQAQCHAGLLPPPHSCSISAPLSIGHALLRELRLRDRSDQRGFGSSVGIQIKADTPGIEQRKAFRLATEMWKDRGAPRVWALKPPPTPTTSTHPHPPANPPNQHTRCHASGPSVAGAGGDAASVAPSAARDQPEQAERSAV
jgi:hypothetical protein